jgi:hypothetical protein
MDQWNITDSGLNTVGRNYIGDGYLSRPFGNAIGLEGVYGEPYDQNARAVFVVLVPTTNADARANPEGWFGDIAVDTTAWVDATSLVVGEDVGATDPGAPWFLPLTSDHDVYTRIFTAMTDWLPYSLQEDVDRAKAIAVEAARVYPPMIPAHITPAGVTESSNMASYAGVGFWAGARWSPVVAGGAAAPIYDEAIDVMSSASHVRPYLDPDNPVPCFDTVGDNMVPPILANFGLLSATGAVLGFDDPLAWQVAASMKSVGLAVGADLVGQKLSITFALAWSNLLDTVSVARTKYMTGVGETREVAELIDPSYNWPLFGINPYASNVSAMSMGRYLIGAMEDYSPMYGRIPRPSFVSLASRVLNDPAKWAELSVALGVDGDAVVHSDLIAQAYSLTPPFSSRVRPGPDGGNDLLWAKLRPVDQPYAEGSNCELQTGVMRKLFDSNWRSPINNDPALPGAGWVGVPTICYMRCQQVGYEWRPLTCYLHQSYAACLTTLSEQFGRLPMVSNVPAEGRLPQPFEFAASMREMYRGVPYISMYSGFHNSKHGVANFGLSSSQRITALPSVTDFDASSEMSIYPSRSFRAKDRKARRTVHQPLEADDETPPV